MTSTIRRKQELSKRSITVTISLESKDSADSALIEKYGDIQINPSGYFNDPNEVSYPKFLVEAGDIVYFAAFCSGLLMPHIWITIDDNDEEEKNV